MASSSRPPLRPVDHALAAYEVLLSQVGSAPQRKLPSERHLAAAWKVSQSAVNRASLRLIAAGRLRREGYALYPAHKEHAVIQGARVVVLTHRSCRYTGMVEEAAKRGVRAEEWFFVGRDSLRQQLRKAIAAKVDGIVFRLSDGGWEWDAEAAEMEASGIAYVVGDEVPAGHAMAGEDWRGAGALLVSHLAESGHSELAFLGSLRRAHRSVAVRHAYEERCLRLGLNTSARRVIELPTHTREAVDAACEELRRDHPEVTALLVYDMDHVGWVLQAFKRSGIKVPDDISLVAVGDKAEARHARPPVSCAGFDSKQLGHLVLDQLCRLIESRRDVRPLRIQPRVWLGADLEKRSSVRIRGEGRARPDEADLLNNTSRVWPVALDARLKEARALRDRPQRLAEGKGMNAFLPLDLRSLANRSLTRQNGWLGQFPLLHVPVGTQVVHGVPFELIDEKSNHGQAAIVLRSQRASGGHSAPPVKLSIPVGRRVRAVYFLHGCGFVSTSSPFAWYDFVMEGRRTVSVPLVARGLGPMQKGDEEPNIQDWWSEFPQIERPGVQPYVVTEGGDPFLYERYLYSLEWISPQPDAVLSEIRISSNPTQPTTLGLLAVTLLIE